MKYLAILLLAFSVPSCSGINKDDATLQSVEYICTASTALLKTAIAAGATPAKNPAITHAVQILTPVCSQSTPPTLDSTAHAALSSALVELVTATKP